ncbi:MAG: hypothetical protein AAF802_28530, partial [Planctomycetota bacterium]
MPRSIGMYLPANASDTRAAASDSQLRERRPPLLPSSSRGSQPIKRVANDSCLGLNQANAEVRFGSFFDFGDGGPVATLWRSFAFLLRHVEGLSGVRRSCG